MSIKFAAVRSSARSHLGYSEGADGEPGANEWTATGWRSTGKRGEARVRELFRLLGEKRLS